MRNEGGLDWVRARIGHCFLSVWSKSVREAGARRKRASHWPLHSVRFGLCGATSSGQIHAAESKCHLHVRSPV